jgi:hypothetical protein
MSQASFQLLTPQNAGQLVTALNSLKRGRAGEVTFAMRAGMVGFAAALRCGYDRRRKEVRCVFNGNNDLTTAFPVSSAAICKEGQPRLTDGFPPYGIGKGEHETRWRITGNGDLQVSCSQVVEDDELLVVWTDWRVFRPGRDGSSWVSLTERAARGLDVKMFGRICPKP